MSCACCTVLPLRSTRLISGREMVLSWAMRRAPLKSGWFSAAWVPALIHKGVHLDANLMPAATVLGMARFASVASRLREMQLLGSAQVAGSPA